MIEIPKWVKIQVVANLKDPANLGKLVWVEADHGGNLWLIHAQTTGEANRAIQAAHDAGRFYAISSEVLKDKKCQSSNALNTQRAS